LKPLSKYSPINKFPLEIIDKLELYRSELLKWNKKSNLISRKESETDYHFIDSAYFAYSIKDVSGTWVDVGTGGGFPGLASSVMLPEHKFSLYEVIDRKYAFLHHIKTRCTASAEIFNESMIPSCANHWDNAVCRALMSISEWENLMRDNADTLWFLASEDQKAGAQGWDIYSQWEIPDHGTRFLLRQSVKS